MLALAKSGIAQLVEKQREVLAPTLTRVDAMARERLNKKFRYCIRAADRREATDGADGEGSRNRLNRRHSRLTNPRRPPASPTSRLRAVTVATIEH